MKKIGLFLSVFAGLFSISQAQNVGINTTGAVADPSSMLDVVATDRGVLVPRVSLLATNNPAPVTAPTNSLLVYNTNTVFTPAATDVSPGFYYWSTAAGEWIRILNKDDSWLTTGNYLTGAGIFGTLTNDLILLSTNGWARGAFMNTGELFLNGALTYFPGDIFSAYGTGGNYAVAGYLSGTGAGVAGYFEATSTGASDAGFFSNSSTNANSTVLSVIRGGGNGWNLYVQAPNTSTFTAAAATTTNLTSTGVAGSVNGTATITTLVGGSGGAFTHPSTGVYARVTNGTGNGGIFAGQGVAAGSYPGGSGISGRGAQTGVYGAATTGASGNGGVFSGNGVGIITLGNGSGVTGIGANTGVFGATTGGTATGGVFGGNNLVTTVPASGAGSASTGTTIGVAGYIPNNAVNSMGGYFQRNGGTFVARVCENNAGTDQKIRGTGTASTVVHDLDGNDVTLFSIETPEILFQDYGEANLVNGQAHIDIDPIFTANVTVNEKHPLKVFVQLEGDCQGVYVTNKSATGFDVIELNGGTSNISFSYFIVANRADRYDENGQLLSRFEDVRFLKNPIAIDSYQNETNESEFVPSESKSERRTDTKNGERESQKVDSNLKK